MESPQPIAIPHLQYISLSSNPGAPIACSLQHLWASSDTRKLIWLVFINGLGLPQAFWQPTLQLLQQDLTSGSSSVKSTLFSVTYDRYGQGLSLSRDGAAPKAHDTIDAVRDLHMLMKFVRKRRLPDIEIDGIQVILIAHSIGVPLARLFFANYGAEWPIRGALFLDSNVANLDMVSLFPDPSASDFDPTRLPKDTSLDDLQFARGHYTKMFSPAAPNGENLDRRTLPSFLPRSDGPPLAGSADASGNRPFSLIVVSHDPETFADESLKICTRGLTESYIEPAWHQYNTGLLKLEGSAPGHERAIVVAKGAGHFVQRDNPRCVATEIWRLILEAES